MKITKDQQKILKRIKATLNNPQVFFLFHAFLITAVWLLKGNLSV